MTSMKEVTISDKYLVLRDFGNPEFVWFMQRGFGYRGFIGINELGNDCIAVNLGDSILAYATSRNEILGTTFWLNYILLHELTHWAILSDRAHKHWMGFLCKLLDSLRD